MRRARLVEFEVTIGGGDLPRPGKGVVKLSLAVREFLNPIYAWASWIGRIIAIAAITAGLVLTTQLPVF